MATDGTNPPPCSNDIYENGTLVTVLEGASSNRTEAWVKALALVTGERVDWHYAGGRVMLMAASGADLPRIRAYVTAMHPALHKLSKEEGPFPATDPGKPIDESPDSPVPAIRKEARARAFNSIVREVVERVRTVMRLDDACNYIVPSDLRVLIGQIDRLNSPPKTEYDGLTYYDKDRDAMWFAGLSDKEFADAMAKAGMDLTDSDVSAVECWMPIVAIVDLAAERIKRLLATAAKPQGALVPSDELLVALSTLRGHFTRPEHIESGRKSWGYIKAPFVSCTEEESDATVTKS